MMQLFCLEDTLDLVTFNPTAKDISVVLVAKFSLAWWDYFAPKIQFLNKATEIHLLQEPPTYMAILSNMKIWPKVVFWML